MRVSLAAGVATIIAAAATLAILNLMQPFNAGLAPATCVATNCFCETARSTGVFKQPANSLSSFGYVLTGFLLMFDMHRRRTETAFPFNAAVLFGIAAITVGIGSVMLHATLTLWGQFADVLGMYMVGSFTLVYAIACIAGLTERQAAAAYAAICTLLIFGLLMMPEVRRWLFFVLLVAALVIELMFARPRRPGARKSFLISAALVKALGFAVWGLDQTRRLCAPDSMWQGHAFWHLCGAVSLWLTYRYFRSERPAKMPLAAVDNIKSPA